MSRIECVCLESLEGRQLFASSVGTGSVVNIIGPTSGVTAQAINPRTTGVFFSAETGGQADLDAAIFLSIALGDGGGVKETSFLRSQFAIFEVGGPVQAIDTGLVQTSGGGDTLSVKPIIKLKANTQYRIQFNQRNDLNKITDVSNQPFDAATYTFTTGTNFQQPDPIIKFDKSTVKTRTTNGSYSAVTIGPDGKLYAATLEGYIYRYDINSDGTLANETTYDIVRQNNGGARFITGITFDPRSTDPSNPVLWISHGQAKFGDNPAASDQFGYAANYTGKISRLYGSNLGTYEDVIINIPRSVKDHLNNQISFDPVAKNLYFLIPSHSAMGRADSTWGNRAEELTTSALFRLQLRTKGTRIGIEEWLATNGAINLNPSANYSLSKGANPLRFYAYGIRNAYDMLWHSNGKFYVPGNSSAAGGNTPDDPNTAANESITGVQQFIEDFLFDVVEGGYYGHPNPVRGQYILNGGNPTSANGNTDKFQINQYPVGTLPDSNYKGAAFSFGKNQSPNGVIEYKGNAFGGRLKGSLIVARYSSGDDLVIVTPRSDGTFTTESEKLGVTGFTGFTGTTLNPLDLVEDTRNGNIYVISLVDRFGDGAISLLKPKRGTPSLSATRLVMYDNAPGDANGASKSVTLTNTGSGVLTITRDRIRLTGANRRNFVVTDFPTGDVTLMPGDDTTFTVKYVAGDNAIKRANLAIYTDADQNNPYTTVVQLRGTVAGATAQSVGAPRPVDGKILSVASVGSTIFSDQAIVDEDLLTSLL